MKTLFFATMLVLLNHEAAAQSSNSANTRLPGCRSLIANTPVTDENDAMNRGLCAGEIVALIAVSGFLSKPFAFCKPPEATAHQAIQIVLRASESSSPERNGTDLVVLAIDALARAWPL